MSYPKLVQKNKKSISSLDRLLAKPGIDADAKGYSSLLENLQANILRHHKKEDVMYYFIRFKNKHTPAPNTGQLNEVLEDENCERLKEIKGWLRDLSKLITNAKTQLDKKEDENILCVYCTYLGYKFLEIPEEMIPEGKAFREGLDGRIHFHGNLKKEKFEKKEIPHIIIMHAKKSVAENGDTIAEKDEQKRDKAKIEDATTKLARKLEKLVNETDNESVNENKIGTYIYFKGQLKNPLDPKYDFKEGMGNPRFFQDTFSGKNKELIKSFDLPPLNLVLRKDKACTLAFSCGSFGAFFKIEMNEKAMKDFAAETGTQFKKAFYEKFKKDFEIVKKEYNAIAINLPAGIKINKETLKTIQTK